MVAGRRLMSQAWKTLLVLGVAAAGIWTATHGVAGVAWRDVGQVVRQVTVWQLLLLTGLWLAGLVVYSTVLAGAMPGLGARRGLLMNLTGSAVANVMPLGGAVATGLNWRMARRWGHSNGEFLSFCVVTNALDVVMKLILPLVAVGVLVSRSVHVPTPVWLGAAGCGVALCVIGIAHVLLLRTASPAESRRRRLHEAARRIRDVLVTRWRLLLPGSIGYVTAQIALLFCCLTAVGLRPAVSTVVMAAAIERVSTLVPLTPGGTGFAELGTIAWLVAMGLDPVQVVAGVILYRVFLFALEIPVGGVLLGWWAWWQRWTGQRSREVAHA
jgi:uncharacterized protein (TIRG00374 family)